MLLRAVISAHYNYRKEYRFDSKFRLVDHNSRPWAHQVSVDWEHDFPEIDILLGAEQLTVKELSEDDIRKIERAVKEANKDNRQQEFTEGEEFKAEAVFRSRNRALIRAKKANGDYRCEVCGFNFEEFYGNIGRKYIIAHHVKLIAAGKTITTVDDIALLCANCHAMVHVKNPPIAIDRLRMIVAKTE